MVTSMGSGDQCGTCHISHHGAPGSNVLKVDDIPGWGDLTSGESVQLSAISQSCLRCHASTGVRARQPEFRGQASRLLESGTYLGLESADDHPLGRPLHRAQLPRPSSPRELLRGSRVLSRSVLLRDADQRIECTTCHDPHRRDGATLTGQERQALCSSCHDPSVYAVERHTAVECTDCHALHGGYTASLVAEQDMDVLCRTCHEPNGQPLASRPLRLGAPRGPVGHRDTPRGSCIGCHALHR